MTAERTINKFLFNLAFLVLPFACLAQSNGDIVKQAMQLLEENYIFLDKAQAINKHLEDLLAKDVFKDESLNQLASLLTKEMHSVVDDKHLSASPPRQQVQLEEDAKRSFIDDLSRYRAPILKGYDILENNIGYVNLGYFGGSPDYFSKIDEIMEELMIADAIIIDMRTSLGGSPIGVQYLCSYFIEKDLLLNTIYSRVNDHTENLRTLPVNGVKRPRVPLYILTSSRTFSAAEDFPYTMQSLKRAKIIGETTRGGAHPTRYFPVAKGFGMSIPVARSINPITKTNWEGVGVVPNIKVTANDALDKAIALAKISAEDYKISTFGVLETALNSLESSSFKTQEHQDAVFKILKQLAEMKMLREFEINIVGYSYLQTNKVKSALAIFKANTELFSKSANTYDSYAEALGVTNQKTLALKNYKKAVEVATQYKDENLEAFKTNLKNFQERISKN